MPQELAGVHSSFGTGGEHLVWGPTSGLTDESGTMCTMTTRQTGRLGWTGVGAVVLFAVISQNACGATPDEPSVKPVSPAAPATPATSQQPASEPAVVPVRPRGPVLRPPRVDAPDATEPLRPNMPESTAAELGLKSNPPLVREGAFIANTRGQMVRGKSGRAYFVFDRDATGRTFPPMILLEGPNLAAVERLSEVATPTSRIRLGGQVLAYRGHNYLLVTTPPLMERVEESAPPPAAPAATSSSSAGSPSTAPGAAAPSGAPGEKSIQDIIAEMDSAVGSRQTIGERRPIQTPSDAPSLTGESGGAKGAPASTPGGELSPSVMDSRTLGYLASRRGRLVRTGDGRLTFRPDNGASGKTEPAMTLLPCQNLVALESIADTSGEAATLTMSGEVFVYRGRHFLLASMYVVNRASSNVQPTQ